MNPVDCPMGLMEEARGGDAAALSRLLESYRRYLKLIARSQIKGGMRGRVDPSEAVQEAMLKAYQDYPKFRGTSEQELLEWLRRILVRKLVDRFRDQMGDLLGVKPRDGLEEQVDRAGISAHQALSGVLSSPGRAQSRRERAVLFADALSRLPDEWSEVLILKHLERMSFEEIGGCLGCSPEAARKLWIRAVEKLRLGVAGEDPDGGPLSGEIH